MACGCKKNMEDGGAEVGGLCQRCLWFWVALGIVAFLLIFHYHESDGTVEFG